MGEKTTRRSYLKYVGAAVIIVGAGAAGLAYYYRTLTPKPVAKKLSWLTPTGAYTTEEDKRVVIDDFVAAHPDVEVTLIMTSWERLWEKLMTSVGAGEAPDVMTCGLRNIPPLADVNAIIPLDDYISREKHDMYDDAVWGTCQYAGKTWAVPYALSTKQMSYNNPIYAEWGVDKVPTTWEEYLDAAVKCNHPDLGYYGTGCCGKRFVDTTDNLANWCFANNNTMIDHDTLECTLNTSSGIEAIDTYTSQYTKLKVTPDPIPLTRGDIGRMFQAGEIAEWYELPPWKVQGCIDNNLDFGLTPQPQGPQSVQPMSSLLVTDDSCVSAQSENPELAYEFIETMTTFERQSAFDEQVALTPLMIKTRDLPYYRDTWWWEGYMKVIPYGIREPPSRQWDAFEDTTVEMLQRIYLGQSSVEEAAEWATEKINRQQGVA